jgi:hypothetical protein
MLVTARSISTTAEYADVYGGHSLAGVWLGLDREPELEIRPPS